MKQEGALGMGATPAEAFANYRSKLLQLEVPVQVEQYWIKCAGLYPSYEDMDEALAKHDPVAYAEYGEPAHALMKHVFETKGDEDAMKQAAEIIGERGNVQAMIGVYYAFLHGMGMAYGTSGWNAGSAASVAIGDMRFKLARVWDGTQGFSATML